MDLGQILIAKALYDDATGLDKLYEKEQRENEQLHRDIENARMHRLQRERLLNEQSTKYEAKLDMVKDENDKLYAELEVMRQVVAKKNEVIMEAKKNLESFHKLSVVLNEQASKEKKEKEIFKNMLMNASFLEIAEVNDNLKEEIAGERAFLHKWILSRNSFWELAYRLAQEQGLNLTMEEVKAKAEALKEELLNEGFSAPELKNDNSNLDVLIKPDTQKAIIDEEIERLEGKINLEQQLELINIDSQMNLLKQGIDPELPINEQIKPN